MFVRDLACRDSMISRCAWCRCRTCLLSKSDFSVTILLCVTTSARCEHPTNDWSWILQIDFSHQLFPHRFKACLCARHFFVSPTYTDRNKALLRCMYEHAPPGPFSHPSFNTTPASFRSNNHPATGCPYKCLSSATTGSGLFSHDLGLRERGKRIQMTGRSASDNLNSFGASSQFYLAPPAHPAAVAKLHPVLWLPSCATQKSLVQ